MAAKKDTNREATNAAERGAGPGFWPVLVPVVGAALAVLGPALALGGKAIRDRREQSSRMPGLAVIPVVGGLLTVIGAVLWRDRERALEIAGDAVATAEGVARDLAGRLTGDAAPEEPAMSDSTPDFGLPVSQGTPVA